MDNKYYSEQNIYNRNNNNYNNSYNNYNNNYNSMNNIPYKNFEKYNEREIKTSQSQMSSNYKNKKDENFENFKITNNYTQKNSNYFKYDNVDDNCRHYSPYRHDFERSRFGSYIYNYYLNAPMRGDISEDFRYPPQYYYRPKYDPVAKSYSNL